MEKSFRKHSEAHGGASLIKQKLCYIIPRYREDDDTHFSYLVPFVVRLGHIFNLGLIIERGEKPDAVSGISWIRSGSDVPVVRFLKLFTHILWARFSGFKIFYIHYSFTAAILASFVVKIFGGKVLYWNCGMPWNYRRGFLRDFFERTAYKLVSHLVTGTEGLARQYAAYYGITRDTIRVMPNWIDVDFFKSAAEHNSSSIRSQLNISPQTAILLFAHRLSERKGAHHLIRIAKGIAHKNFIILIAGDGPLRASLESLFLSEGLQNRVRFLGAVSHKKMAGLFGAADIFILPSEEEGFPHVLLEAMAVGVPFVAFRVGGIAEMIPKDLAVKLITPRNISEFVHTIDEILSTSSEKKDILRRTEQEWVRTYAIERVTGIFTRITLHS